MKKEKSKPTITSLRRSGRLSATSGTCSSLSPDIMEDDSNKLKLVEDEAKVFLNLKNTSGGQVDVKNDEVSSLKEIENEVVVFVNNEPQYDKKDDTTAHEDIDFAKMCTPVNDVAGMIKMPRYDIEENTPANKQIDSTKMSPDVNDADLTKVSSFTPENSNIDCRIVENVKDDAKKDVEEMKEKIAENSFVFPSFNLNISQDCLTPKLNDDDGEVQYLGSTPGNIEKVEVKVKQEFFEAWELKRGLIPGLHHLGESSKDIVQTDGDGKLTSKGVTNEKTVGKKAANPGEVNDIEGTRGAGDNN